MEGCEGKKVFHSYSDTRRVSVQMNRKHAKAHVVPYKCKRCGQWHIGNDATNHRGLRRYEREKFANFDGEMAEE